MRNSFSYLYFEANLSDRPRAARYSYSFNTTVADLAEIVFPPYKLNEIVVFRQAARIRTIIYFMLRDMEVRCASAAASARLS